MEHLIVIGTESDKENPLAKALAVIGRALGCAVRVLICTPTGTYPHDSEEKKPTTQRIGGELLDGEDATAPRLLLFDAVSMKKDTPPTGLLAWLARYRALNNGKEPQWLPLPDVVDTFFSRDGGTGAFRTGLVQPERQREARVQDLARPAWKELMDALCHDEMNARRAGQ